MRIVRGLAAAAALMAGLGGVAVATIPAQADGNTGRTYGCAAHWRHTANWNECVGAPGVNIQLQIDCEWEMPTQKYTEWKYVRGNQDPVNRYECGYRTNGASNAFRF
jgi:hypothetical protein